MVTFQCTSTVSQKISQTSMQQFDIPQINPGPPGIRTKITGHAEAVCSHCAAR